MLDLITAADFYFYTLLNKSSLKFENKGKWKRPDSCVSKEVFYNLAANLQLILSQQARKQTQNVPQPFPAMKFTLIKKETKNHFWSRHLENTLIESQQQCSLTIAYDNLKYTEVYKSDAKTLHGVIIFRIVDGNYIYIYIYEFFMHWSLWQQDEDYSTLCFCTVPFFDVSWGRDTSTWSLPCVW